LERINREEKGIDFGEALERAFKGREGSDLSAALKPALPELRAALKTFDREFFSREIDYEIELYCRTLDTSANPPLRTAQPIETPLRLRFDQQALVVYLDGRQIPVQSPKAFLLFKTIAEHEGPITRAGLRSRSAHFRGDKTVRKLLALLPAALRRTIKSNYSGYWLQLAPAKEIRT
jgi:hypothetical protein